ncbi:MAG: dihydrofolate reductase [Bdellovibrionaceae bacterium]|nr:dihydrofolate reductase [Pseudobdellovibrionaceae bacterium]
MILAHIAAMAANRVIGKDNGLPWHLPEDLKWFKEKTKGSIMIMGRKTFESLPGHLPDRMHVVISRNPWVTDEEDVVFVKSIEEALKFAKEHFKEWKDEVFVIGGGEIYAQTLPLADRLYLTVIEKNFAGDTHYPEFNERDFNLIEIRKFEKPLPFSIRTYERKKN